MRKKLIKYSMIVIMLGICGLYTYRFLINDFTSMKKITNHTEQTSGEAVNYQTASPDEIKKTDIGWERIKYVYMPRIKDLLWTNVKEKYSIDGVEYTVLDARIQNEWNPKWNYEVIKDEYPFNSEKKLKGDKSFLSVTLEIKNMNDEVYESYINNVALHVYEKEGKKIASKELDTASLDKPYTKSFYRILLKEQEEFKIELVYVITKKMMSDEYYYFIDVNPYAIYPTSKEQIGIFKLPLGAERKSHESNKK